MIDKLFDDREAFVDYFKKNDSQETRDSIIKTDKLRYWYCGWVEDREEVWVGITSDEYRYWYCKDVEDRKELWSKITDDEWRFFNCSAVDDR